MVGPLPFQPVEPEGLRAKACCGRFGGRANDDAQVDVRIVGQFYLCTARIHEQVDESKAGTPVSGIDDRNEPVSDCDSPRRMSRRVPGFIEHEERTLQPRSTSRPSASQ